MTERVRPEHVRRQVFTQRLAIFVALTLGGSLIAFTAAVVYVATFLRQPPFGVNEFDSGLDGFSATLAMWALLSVGGAVAAAVSTVVDWRLNRSGGATTSRGTLIAAASGPAAALPLGLVLMIWLLWYDVLLSVSLAMAGTAVFFAVLTLFHRVLARASAPVGAIKAPTG